MAFGMTLLMAVTILIIRRQHETPMMSAACLSALLCPLLVWPVAAPFDIATTDPLKLFLFGTTRFGLGLVFLVAGGRLVSATESAWVWVCFNEMPTGSSLVGGIIVMVAVAAHVWHSSRVQIVSATG